MMRRNTVLPEGCLAAVQYPKKPDGKCGHRMSLSKQHASVNSVSITFSVSVLGLAVRLLFLLACSLAAGGLLAGCGLECQFLTGFCAPFIIRLIN